MDADEKTTKRTKAPVVICISGMAGSGKSTLAKRLAEKYGLKYYSGGDALKALAIEEGYKPLRHGWWESKEGKRFLVKRTENMKYDKAVDKKLLKTAAQGNVVLDSWTMPWLLRKGFKIWLEASLEKRAKRIAKRDGISLENAFEALRSKEKQTRTIYKKLYGFDLGKDFTPFHLILDTNNLKADEVFQTLCAVIENVAFNFEN
ncbi:MAG: cytidylate kinase family protein [Candidatus Bathyarchaeota archaeon]|nr:cytidylate kinase family protein [Candidatus Bathyarchaeota archaeon]MDH5787407.1 cytidylate kinase family protein [Candidatus Bathyarchaeota archaeon]